MIPPTINIENPDPDCDLDYVPTLPRKAEIEHAICNCIAFGSKNSALVVRKVA
jgi:3-oxoacyl-[acyl-carrier-protein] synthase II